MHHWLNFLNPVFLIRELRCIHLYLDSKTSTTPYHTTDQIRHFVLLRHDNVVYSRYFHIVTKHCKLFRLIAIVNRPIMGVLQGGPGGPWHTQNFGWVGHKCIWPHQ